MQCHETKSHLRQLIYMYIEVTAFVFIYVMCYIAFCDVSLSYYMYNYIQIP